MRRVIWTRASQRDVAKIREYIGQFNPPAAQRTASKLIAAGNSLAESPSRGRPIGKERRELTIIWPYIIRYRLEGDTAYILRVRHGAQRPL